jgi:hypothetical protein
VPLVERVEVHEARRQRQDCLGIAALAGQLARAFERVDIAVVQRVSAVEQPRAEGLAVGQCKPSRNGPRADDSSAQKNR